MKTKESYYLNINSINLGHYINKGLIAASRYYENRKDDIQSIIGDNILLTDKKLEYLNESDMIIKINNLETNFLKKINSNIFFYQKPIPISNIEKIATTENIDLIIANIEKTGREGYIHKEIFLDSNYNKSAKYRNIDIKNLETKFEYSEETKQNINKYNLYLGAYSLYSTLTNESDIDFFKNIDNTIYNILSKEIIDKNDIDKEAKKEYNIQEFKKRRYIFNENLNYTTNSYLLMQIYNLPKIDTFMGNYERGNFNNLSEGIKKKLFIYYGIHKGYSALKNRYYNIKTKFDLKEDKKNFRKIFDFVFNDILPKVEEIITIKNNENNKLKTKLLEKDNKIQELEFSRFKMSELKDKAKEKNIRIPHGIKKDDLIKLLIKNINVR
jgi:hypothetical protein